MKSLAKNSIYNVLYRVISVLFPLIMISYASQVLQPQGIGRVSSAQNIAQYFVLVAALGLPTYGTKKIAACLGVKKEVNRTFSELIIINTVSTIICSVAYYLMISVLPFYRERFPIYAATGLAIVFNFFNIDWYYQGTEEYRYIMLRSLVVKILSLGVLLVFVRTPNDIVQYALVVTMAKVANYIFNIIHVRHRVNFTLEDINVKQHIKQVIVLLAAAIAVEVYTLADTTMLTFMCGDEIVGYYSNSIKCISVIRTLIAAVCAVFLPRLSFYYAKKDYDSFNNLITRGFKILFTFTIPAAIGCALVADDFIPVLFGTSFLGSVVTTRILAISVITVAFSNFIGYQILVTVGKEKIMLISTVVGAAVNVILNYFLIRLYQHNGAAVASVITEGNVALIQLISIRKVVKLGPMLKETILPSLAGAGSMIILIVIFKNVFNSGILRLAISIMIGIATYFVVNIALKNDLVPMVMNKLRRKV